MARPLVATVLPLLLLAGCFHPQGTAPGPDNPQVVLYRTKDFHLQIVVKGAFKDREYERVEVLANGATLAAENRTYLVSEKLNLSSVNLTVLVALEKEAYRWDAALTLLPDGMRIVEVEQGIAGRPETRNFPFAKILEKVPEDSP